MKSLTASRPKVSFAFLEATQADIPMLVELNRQAAAQKIFNELAVKPDEASEEKSRAVCTKELQENFAINDFHVLVAYDKKDSKKTPLGYASYFDTDEQRHAYLQDLHTLNTYKGIDTALDENIKKIVNTQSADYLEVRSTEASKPFYLKREYHPVSGNVLRHDFR